MSRSRLNLEHRQKISSGLRRAYASGKRSAAAQGNSMRGRVQGSGQREAARAALLEKPKSLEARIKMSAAKMKTGKYLNPRGYVYVTIPPQRRGNGPCKILEHRLVMEQKLGRPLMGWEHVHHKNGIKNDNRPENLEIVLNRNHRGHISCHHCGREFAIK